MSYNAKRGRLLDTIDVYCVEHPGNSECKDWSKTSALYRRLYVEDFGIEKLQRWSNLARQHDWPCDPWDALGMPSACRALLVQAFFKSVEYRDACRATHWWC